jgi:N-acetylmuramoyl-L-alanine amidase
MRKINKIILHCSDTPNSMYCSVKTIREWHLNRGWRDVGYHYVIRQDGEIEVGRQEHLIGAHCRGYNASSIGVCLVGNGDYTGKQMEALDELVDSLMRRYKIDEVAGHYKYNSRKECPRINVERWVEARYGAEFV